MIKLLLELEMRLKSRKYPTNLEILFFKIFLHSPARCLSVYLLLSYQLGLITILQSWNLNQYKHMELNAIHHWIRINLVYNKFINKHLLFHLTINNMCQIRKFLCRIVQLCRIIIFLEAILQIYALTTNFSFFSFCLFYLNLRHRQVLVCGNATN